MRQHAIPGAGRRQWLLWAACIVAVPLVVSVGFGAAVDRGYLRGWVTRIIRSHIGRPLEIAGALTPHVLSFHPRMTAERVSIGNPPWSAAGSTAEIDRLEIAFQLPWFGRSFGIEKFEARGAVLHLERDATGRANWQLTDPAKGDGKGLPIVQELTMPDAHVHLADDRRHLKFDGTVSAVGVPGKTGARPLRIEGHGQLNGREVTFDVDSDPLATARHDAPYHFTYSEQSSGSKLSGSGVLPQPFDFDFLDASFEAAGADLRDLYYLTGVTLINTGSYRLTGTIARRGALTSFKELAVTSGQSDMQGSVSVDSSSARPMLRADLTSRVLHLADLGARAAGRESPEAAATPLLLSNAKLNPAATRRGDAVVDFHGRRVEIGHIPMTAVAAKMTIDHGILVIAPLSAEVLDGKLEARVRLDARTDDPPAEATLTLTNLELGRLLRSATGPPAAEGLIRARVTLNGHGSSIHEVASNANGILSAALPHGIMRTSLAELTGIDLQGLGLKFTKDQRDTAVRCGVASFEAHAGNLEARTIVIDTLPVLITADGTIHLDSEALDLVIRGHPKGMRLGRVRSPILIRGTLSHPSVSIQTRTAVAQTAVAVALGILLTPVASVLAFVDPGLAKNADCAALLASEHPR